MMINQMSVTSILKSNQTKFTVGMAEVPYDEAGGTFWFGDEVCVTKEAGTGAVSFAQYLIKKEISERINDTMGTLQVYTGISYKKKEKSIWKIPIIYLPGHAPCCIINPGRISAEK